MSATADLLAVPLARMLRCQRRSEGITLTFVDDFGQRAVRGDRLNQGVMLALAAWAEIADREPTIRHRAKKESREHETTRPWRDGKTSAWAYLRLAADDRMFGGPARQMLDGLARRGIEAP